MNGWRRARKALALAPHRDYWRALAHGVGAGIEHHDFLATGDWRTILDVGANKGQFALAAHHAHPGATILAFEPLAGPRETFAALFRGHAGVTVAPYALGAETGTATIHLSAREDSSSLLAIGARQEAVFPGTEEIGTATVEVRRLDDLALAITRPALLKIDVQGFELKVLEGAEQTLAAIDDLYVELSFVELYHGQPTAEEVTHWLAARGFTRRAHYHLTSDTTGTAIQADVHFGRE